MAVEAAKNQPPAAANPTPPAAPEEAEAKPGKKAGKKGETIEVRGPETGRYRAGRYFTREPATIDLSTITVDDLAAIEGDPHLTVKRG